jgi:hypothetical protein
METVLSKKDFLPMTGLSMVAATIQSFFHSTLYIDLNQMTTYFEPVSDCGNWTSCSTKLMKRYAVDGPDMA